LLNAQTTDSHGQHNFYGQSHGTRSNGEFMLIVQSCPLADDLAVKY